jgi:hypothetical protein
VPELGDPDETAPDDTDPDEDDTDPDDSPEVRRIARRSVTPHAPAPSVARRASQRARILAGEGVRSGFILGKDLRRIGTPRIWTPATDDTSQETGALAHFSEILSRTARLGAVSFASVGEGKEGLRLAVPTRANDS